jgi:hypothetical protein
MFKAIIGFNKGILNLPIQWQAWMVLLVTLNLVSPLFLLGHTEALVALVGTVVSLTIMTALYAKFGFVRLLGLGHFPWLFTVPWLFLQLGKSTESGLFHYWLISVIVIDSISLVIDTVDVARYWMGDRQPTIMTDLKAI